MVGVGTLVPAAPGGRAGGQGAKSAHAQLPPPQAPLGSPLPRVDAGGRRLHQDLAGLAHRDAPVGVQDERLPRGAAALHHHRPHRGWHGAAQLRWLGAQGLRPGGLHGFAAMHPASVAAVAGEWAAANRALHPPSPGAPPPIWTSLTNWRLLRTLGGPIFDPDGRIYFGAPWTRTAAPAHFLLCLHALAASPRVDPASTMRAATIIALSLALLCGAAAAGRDVLQGGRV